MGHGWKEIARLGGTRARYPHVLLDKQGWCLRLGRKDRSDDLYYSSLPVLLRGLVEQSVRHRLMSLPRVLEIQELCREVEDALRSALGMCHEALVRGGLEAHIRQLKHPSRKLGARTTSSASSAPGPGRYAVSGPSQGRKAV